MPSSPQLWAIAILTAMGTITANVDARAQSDFPARVDPSHPNPQPPYPVSAQLSGEQGTIMVDVLVRPSGKPGKARISLSSGYEDLDTAAVQGVLNWRFLPAVHGGDTVSDWTTVKIEYRLPALPPSPEAPATGHP